MGFQHDSLNAGYDAMYIAQDAGATARRTQRQRDARSNLAAFMLEEVGVDPRGADPADVSVRAAANAWATLGDMLGLPDLNADDDRAPGYCGLCGAKLPVRASDPVVADGRRRGLCYHCTTGQPVRRRFEPEPEPEPAAPTASTYRGGVGHCPCCDRDYHLQGDGRLRDHPAWTVGRDGLRRRSTATCPGSGQRVDELAAPPEAHPTTAWGRALVGEP